MSNTREVRDPMWWGGEPIWVDDSSSGQTRGAHVLARLGGADQGSAAGLWEPFDERSPGNSRVDQVLAWLDLPADRAANVPDAVHQ